AIMLENIVIEQKDAEKLAENGITLAHGDVHAATKTLEEAVADRKTEASGRFARNEKGFVSEIEAGEKTVAFFSVPYSKGWSATVNGQKTDVLDAGGMMAVALEKGTNTVVFTYKTPGFTAGAVMFSIGMLAAAAEIIVYAVRGKSRKSKGNAEKRRKM
ncbi:MAG: YfhO family protein, partial [Clostridia bacterium]|nr:YfhO family protein [Clostridia bacterium]